jgi:hypothetical protein
MRSGDDPASETPLLVSEAIRLASLGIESNVPPDGENA